MTVVDASCVVELLLRSQIGLVISHQLTLPNAGLCAPALIDVEACHVIRKRWLAKTITAERGREAVDDLATFQLARYPHVGLLPSIWQWRNNLSAYDAAYVAQAEALNAPLATCDKKLAAAVGGKIRVEVF